MLSEKRLLELGELAWDAIQDARKDSERIAYHISNLAVANKSGAAIFIKSTACHAGLEQPALGDISVVVSAIQKEAHGSLEERCPGASRVMVDWLVNRSPWAMSFVSKDADKILEQGYVVSNTRYCGNIMVGGSIALRSITEYTSIGETFYHLVSAGANENFAFLMSHFGSVGGGGINFDTHKEGHTSVYVSCFTEVGLTNFIKGKFPKMTLDMPSYKKASKYMGLRTAFNNSVYGGRVSTFGRAVSAQHAAELKLLNVEAKANVRLETNPFGYPVGYANGLQNIKISCKAMVLAMNWYMKGVLKIA